MCREKNPTLRRCTLKKCEIGHNKISIVSKISTFGRRVHLNKIYKNDKKTNMTCCTVTKTVDSSSMAKNINFYKILYTHKK